MSAYSIGHLRFDIIARPDLLTIDKIALVGHGWGVDRLVALSIGHPGAMLDNGLAPASMHEPISQPAL